jgi:hypothetical protein
LSLPVSGGQGLFFLGLQAKEALFKLSLNKVDLFFFCEQLLLEGIQASLFFLKLPYHLLYGDLVRA